MKRLIGALFQACRSKGQPREGYDGDELVELAGRWGVLRSPKLDLRKIATT
jgi:hypothetical protein